MFPEVKLQSALKCRGASIVASATGLYNGKSHTDNNTRVCYGCPRSVKSGWVTGALDSIITISV